MIVIIQEKGPAQQTVRIRQILCINSRTSIATS